MRRKLRSSTVKIACNEGNLNIKSDWENIMQLWQNLNTFSFPWYSLISISILIVLSRKNRITVLWCIVKIRIHWLISRSKHKNIIKCLKMFFLSVYLCDVMTLGTAEQTRAFEKGSTWLFCKWHNQCWVGNYNELIG